MGTHGNDVPGLLQIDCKRSWPHRAEIVRGTRVSPYCGDRGHHITAYDVNDDEKRRLYGYRPNTTEAVHYGVYRH